MKVLYTGGNGQLANQLKLTNTALDIYYPTKEECDLTSLDSIKNYTAKNSEFDIVVTGANRFPGHIDDLVFESFDIPVKHLVLIENLKRKPAYFINLTTGLAQVDEHYLYRAQKCFAEDLFLRYFGYESNKNTHFINFFPGHIDSKSLRITIAIKFIEMLENIGEYKQNQYVFEEQTKSIINSRFG